MKRPMFLIVPLLMAGPALAQEKGKALRRIQEVREVHAVGIAGGDGVENVRFAWSAEAFEGKQPVKNAPYSAVGVTELEQTLGDGNRIKQTTKSQLARDREGRTRRELTLGAVGPLAAGDTPKMIFLQDPVGGTNYTLDPEHKIARKMPKPTELALPPAIGAIKGKRIERVDHDEDFFTAPAPPPGAPGALGPFPRLQPLGGIGLSVKGMPAPKTEDLGTQVMEGVRVQGTRTTATIPAGAIGNERPIVSVSERWYSPDLGVVVMSKHSDPRLGTTTYKLTNVVRNDPDAALFQVPADYAVKEDPGHTLILRRTVERAAPEKP
ncbi:MAG TPA: hypothetical protein VN914_20085 [Polyangia bacterium]|nr:hypothetical protein [Polyangia bacterium]